MTPLFRKLHKWLGLIIGIQFVLWLASGLTMSLLDPDLVDAKNTRAKVVEGQQWTESAADYDALFAHAPADVTAIRSGWLLGRPVFHLTSPHGTDIVDARTMERIVLDSPQISRLAKSYYAGNGVAASPRLLDHTGEARDFDGKLWRVDFNDENDTTVYVAADTGELVEMRNKSWRLFDLAWMFHIMDYTNRVNFNNPLIVASGLSSLMLSLFGFWLLFASFRFADFVPSRFLRKHSVKVVDPSGLALKEVPVPRGEDVFSGLRQAGVELPSNCGGGQSCGLCAVRVRNQQIPATAADRAMLSAEEIRSGYRLACNLPVKRDLCIEVGTSSEAWAVRTGVVSSVRSYGPYLRELSIRPDEPLAEDYPAGSFVQVSVPEFDCQRGDLWRGIDDVGGGMDSDLKSPISNRLQVRRSYSLCEEVKLRSDREIRLLVRWSPGSGNGKVTRPGKGSSYLFARRPGDAIEFTGPFGNFRLKPTDAPKVFLGSGAGMGPLRAMALEQCGRNADVNCFMLSVSHRKEPLPFHEEFLSLADRSGKFTYLPTVPTAEEPDPVVAKQIRKLLALLRSQNLDIHRCEYYLCGGPRFIREARMTLQTAGISDAQLSQDDFLV